MHFQLNAGKRGKTRIVQSPGGRAGGQARDRESARALPKLLFGFASCPFPTLPICAEFPGTATPVPLCWTSCSLLALPPTGSVPPVWVPAQPSWGSGFLLPRPLPSSMPVRLALVVIGPTAFSGAALVSTRLSCLFFSSSVIFHLAVSTGGILCVLSCPTPAPGFRVSLLLRVVLHQCLEGGSTLRQEKKLKIKKPEQT